MINILSTAADNNGSGISRFCPFAVPFLVPGAWVIAAVYVDPGAGELTPPSDAWHLIGRADSGNNGTLWVWRYQAFGDEEGLWVFVAAVAQRIAGVLAVTTGTDANAPIDAAVPASSPTGTAVNLGAAWSAAQGVMLLGLVASSDAVTYTPATGYATQRTRQNGVTVAAWARVAQAAAPVSATAGTASAPTESASLLLALYPAPPDGVPQDALREQLIDLMPPGSRELLDCEPGGSFSQLFGQQAGMLKASVLDPTEVLRAELDVGRQRQFLPEAEALLGLSQSRATRSGDTLRRRGQVRTGWRASVATSSRDDVKAVLGPVLGYANPSQLEIVEHSRAAVTALHRVDYNGAGAGNDTLTFVLEVRDRERVSSAGATVALVVSHPDLTELSVTLTRPDAVVHTLMTAGLLASGEQLTGAASMRAIVMRVRAATGADIYKDWTLAVTDTSGAAWSIDGGSYLLVEGIGRDTEGRTGLASAMFRWAVVTHPALVGETNPPDFEVARRYLETLRQSHTDAGLCSRMSDGSLGCIVGDELAIVGACVVGNDEDDMTQRKVLTATIGAGTTYNFTFGPVVDPVFAVHGLLGATIVGASVTSYTATSAVVELSAPIDGEVHLTVGPLT